MDPVTVIAAAAPLLGGLAAAVRVVLQYRARTQRLSYRDLRELPPGSRVIDLGERGLVIEIGTTGRTTPSSAADDER